MAEPLVEGAAFKSWRTMPAMIPSHTLPDIHSNTIVVAACGVDILHCTQVKNDGWFLADFCAFNYLLKGAGYKQTWITALSEADLLAKIAADPNMQPGLLHGNPFHDRKIVFSADLVEKGQLTTFTVRQPSEVTTTFIEEVKAACSISLKSSPPAPVLLLIFGHGLDDLSICLDYSQWTKEKFPGSLHVNELQRAVPSGVPITVVTTACFSGGWVIQPDLNMTIITASAAPPSPPAAIKGSDEAGPRVEESTMGSRKVSGGSPDSTLTEKDGPWLSLSWNASKSVTRSCGSIFASTMFRTLSLSTSPLLRREEATEAAHDTQSTGASPHQLQPPEPTEVQSQSYNAFCTSISRTLSAEITRLPGVHEFRFSAQDDDWASCWMKRTGIPLVDFGERWESLAVYPQKDPKVYWCDLDPANPLWADDVAEIAATGGTSSNPLRAGGASAGPSTSGTTMNPLSLGAATGDKETLPGGDAPGPRVPPAGDPTAPGAAFQHMMRIKALMLVEACPGDWQAAPSLRLRGILQSYALQEPGWDTEEEFIISVIHFRLDFARFVDMMVATYHLPRPYNQTCLYWDISRWYYKHDTHCQRFRDLTKWLNETPLNWKGTEKQGGYFGRPPRYLLAALFDSDYDDASRRSIIRAIGECAAKGSKELLGQIIKKKEVRAGAERWFGTLGKRMRSVSPAKKGGSPPKRGRSGTASSRPSLESAGMRPPRDLVE